MGAPLGMARLAHPWRLARLAHPDTARDSHTPPQPIALLLAPYVARAMLIPRTSRRNTSHSFGLRLRALRPAWESQERRPGIITGLPAPSSPEPANHAVIGAVMVFEWAG